MKILDYNFFPPHYVAPFGESLNYQVVFTQSLILFSIILETLKLKQQFEHSSKIKLFS